MGEKTSVGGSGVECMVFAVQHRLGRLKRVSGGGSGEGLVRGEGFGEGGREGERKGKHLFEEGELGSRTEGGGKRRVGGKKLFVSRLHDARNKWDGRFSHFRCAHLCASQSLKFASRCFPTCLSTDSFRAAQGTKTWPSNSVQGEPGAGKYRSIPTVSTIFTSRHAP